MATLYAIGWRARGAPRRWQWTELEAVEQATEIAHANVRFDGSGRWRVYETLIETSGGRARTVRGRLLAEGVEPMAASPERADSQPPVHANALGADASRARDAHSRAAR